MARSRKLPRSIRLPWEHGSFRFGVFSRRRVGVVVAGCLAIGGAIFVWRTGDEHERTAETRATIGEVQRAVARFRAEVGRCPRSTLELVHPPRSATRYLREVPADGWGHPLFVRCPGSGGEDDVDVVSAGPSGDFQTDDNVI